MARGARAGRSQPHPAVKLPFKTGDYLCTWQVPDGQGGFVEVPGSLTVEPGKWTHGQVYGTLPISWQNGAASFPQRHEFDVLVGQLSSGSHVLLLAGEVSYWFEGQGNIIAKAAILSRRPFTPDAQERRYSSIKFQIEGLDAISGIAPIKATKHPVEGDEDRTWGAITNQDANWTWKNDGVSLEFAFWGSFQATDAYEFHLRFSPYVTLTSEAPLTIQEWRHRWVVPMRQLISLATGEPQDITYVIAMNGEVLLHAAGDQVFGWDFSQAPYNSTTEAIRDMRSAINLKEDELSLLDLMQHWQRLVDEQNPIIETYSSMTTDREQHPRSRFLLQLQALEGLYGFENKAKNAKDAEQYSAKRKAFMTRAEGLLEKIDFKFLDKNLMRYPQQGLETALIVILKSLPADVRPELESTALSRSCGATTRNSASSQSWSKLATPCRMELVALSL